MVFQGPWSSNLGPRPGAQGSNTPDLTFQINFWPHKAQKIQLFHIANMLASVKSRTGAQKEGSLPWMEVIKQWQMWAYKSWRKYPAKILILRLFTAKALSSFPKGDKFVVLLGSGPITRLEYVLTGQCHVFFILQGLDFLDFQTNFFNFIYFFTF